MLLLFFRPHDYADTPVAVDQIGFDADMYGHYLQELKRRKKKREEEENQEEEREQSPVEVVEELIEALPEIHSPDPVPALSTFYSHELDEKLKAFVSLSETLRSIEERISALKTEEVIKESIVLEALLKQEERFRAQQVELARRIQEMHEEEEAMVYMLLMH